MNRADVLAALTQIFRENFDDDALMLTPATTARDIAGWDSAKMVLLILSVEERFGIRLHSREIDALRSIGDWLDVIERASSRSSAA
ncbi:MAG: acyl carrier protein [Methylovirgula sp.]